jgi:hypothetical protein
MHQCSQSEEIKPMSANGYTSFNAQTAKLDLSDPVQAITYDKQGNIYYGFVGPWQKSAPHDNCLWIAGSARQ